MDNQNLQKRIEALELEVASLRQTNTIPLEVDRAFVGRKFIKYSGNPQILDALNFTPSLSQSLSLSGNPETIYVPQFPSAYLWITEGNAAGYYIPLLVPPRTF